MRIFEHAEGGEAGLEELGFAAGEELGQARALDKGLLGLGDEVEGGGSGAGGSGGGLDVDFAVEGAAFDGAPAIGYSRFSAWPRRRPNSSFSGKPREMGLPSDSRLEPKDSLPTMMKALQPCPGAAVSISQTIERHFGREALYPINVGGNETPA